MHDAKHYFVSFLLRNAAYKISCVLFRIGYMTSLHYIAIRINAYFVFDLNRNETLILYSIKLHNIYDICFHTASGNVPFGQ